MLKSEIKEYELYKKIHFDNEKIEAIRGYPVGGAFQFEIKLESSEGFQAIKNNNSQSLEYSKPHAMMLMKTLGVDYDNIENLFHNQNVNIVFDPPISPVTINNLKNKGTDGNAEKETIKNEVSNYLLNSYAEYLDKDGAEKFLKKALLKAKNNGGEFNLDDATIKDKQGALVVKSPKFNGHTIEMDYEGDTHFNTQISALKVYNKNDELIYNKDNEAPFILEKKLVAECHQIFKKEFSPANKSRNSYK